MANNIIDLMTSMGKKPVDKSFWIAFLGWITGWILLSVPFAISNDSRTHKYYLIGFFYREYYFYPAEITETDTLVGDFYTGYLILVGILLAMNLFGKEHMFISKFSRLVPLGMGFGFITFSYIAVALFPAQWSYFHYGLSYYLLWVAAGLMFLSSLLPNPEKNYDRWQNIAPSEKKFVLVFIILVFIHEVLPNIEYAIEDLLVGTTYQLEYMVYINEILFLQIWIAPVGIYYCIERYVFYRATKFVLTVSYIMNFIGFTLNNSLILTISYYSLLILAGVAGIIALKKPIRYQRAGLIWAFAEFYILFIFDRIFNLYYGGHTLNAEIFQMMIILNRFYVIIKIGMYAWLIREIIRKANINRNYSPNIENLGDF